MKKLALVGIVLFSSLALVGCSNDTPSNKDDSSTASSSMVGTTEKPSAESTTESTETDTAESIDIFAKGDYMVGTDIEPGTYYAVLTEMTYAADDSEKNGYVTISVTGESTAHDMFENQGQKKRYILKDGDTVSFDDNYSPTWTVQLLTEKDFQNYMSSTK